MAPMITRRMAGAGFDRASVAVGLSPALQGRRLVRASVFGIVFLVAQAVVGAFAELQYVGLRRAAACPGTAGSDHSRPLIPEAACLASRGKCALRGVRACFSAPDADAGFETVSEASVQPRLALGAKSRLEFVPLSAGNRLSEVDRKENQCLLAVRPQTS